LTEESDILFGIYSSGDVSSSSFFVIPKIVKIEFDVDRYLES